MPFHVFPILDETKITLMPGKEDSFSFSAREFLKMEAKEYLFRLRFCGDCGVHPSWMWEGGFPLLYRDIDDSLCTQTHHSAYSLRLEENAEDYPRSAYFKLLCPPRCTEQFAARPGKDGLWRFGLWLRAEGFRSPDRRAFVRIERFLRKNGRDPRDIGGPADETVVLPLPEGSYPWRRISAELPVKEDTACLLFTVTARRTSGTVYLEDPSFANSEGQSVLPAFAPANRHHENMNWFGENLSRKEWTRLAVTLNGTRLPDAMLFQRCHLRSENEISLPADLILEGDNTLALKNGNDWNGALPYRLQALQLLYAENRAVELQAVPQVVRRDRDFPVLISVREPGTVVRLKADSPAIRPVRPQVRFADAGLQAVYFHAGENGADLTLRVSAGSCSASARVERIVEKDADDVLVGTGDSIYIPQKLDSMREFLVWYLSNHLGNSITFRPTYRWCGTREVNAAMWKETAALCNRMQLAYCHMIDGRELPGINANPTREMLAGECFLGNQGHERDGAFCYWRAPRLPDDSNELFFQELSRRIRKHPDWDYSGKIQYAKRNIYVDGNPDGCTDMKEAREQFVARARESLRGVDRHTGPSAFFREFFAAGLPVGGAETMYGPNEVLLSVLRGASRAYRRKCFLSHLALQWYSTPHDTEANCRRYQLALFVSYLQGVSQINTEEGLWHMEENFAKYDRYSRCCRSHAEVERRFVRFVECHTRRGQPVARFAALHGRYDGWRLFGRGSAWGKNGPEWSFSAPEESWDLLRVFYPDSVIDALYRHPCPDAPQGFYTRTPYGPVDVLPAEAPPEVMARYGSLAFLGYHAMQPQDVGKLCGFVRGGGTLLLAWPHLFTQTNRAKVIAGESAVVDRQEELTGVKLNGFLPSGGECSYGDISLGSGAEILRERDGVPLVVRHALGKGSVLLVNVREFPAAPAVRPVYEALLKRLGEKESALQRAKGWMATGDTVEFAAYDGADGLRRIYAIDVNWWEEACAPAKAELLLGRKSYPVGLRRGFIHTFTVCGDFAVWTADNETEVLSASRRELRVQAGGKVRLFLVGGFRAAGAEGFEARREAEGIWSLTGEVSGIRAVSLELT